MEKDSSFRKIAQILEMPPFQVWLVEELDLLEDRLYGSELSQEETLEVKMRRKILTEVLDKYCYFNKIK